MKKLRSLRICLYSSIRWLVVVVVLSTRCAAEIRPGGVAPKEAWKLHLVATRLPAPVGAWVYRRPSQQFLARLTVFSTAA